MRKNRGFTLIELMVVILIVAILAAVLAPMLSGRINESKWTEGKTGAGTIATAIRAYFAEHEAMPGTTLTDCGITQADLTGKYFSYSSYTLSDLSSANGVPNYTITIDPTDPGKAGAPTGTYTLNQAGVFTYTAP